MCGRFTSTAEPGLVAERFEVTLPEEQGKRYNIAPTQEVLGIRAGAETGEREATTLRWGLIPRWAKDPSIGNRMINARAETIREKPSYRPLLRANRCLIPADGFFEWATGSDGRKVPIRFALADGELFAFAGLWSRWLDRSSGELIDSCTIVTTTPNELVGRFHNRMPAILSRNEEFVWLDASVEPAAALTLLRPYPAAHMGAQPASCRVNSVGNDDPRVLVPDPGAAGLLEAA